MSILKFNDVELEGPVVTTNVITNNLAIPAATFLGEGAFSVGAGNEISIRRANNSWDVVGTVTLVGGTATIIADNIYSTSLVWIAVQSLGTVTTSQVYTYSINPFTDFTITSSDPTDTSTLQYWFFTT
jgi:hypothetical protein